MTAYGTVGQFKRRVRKAKVVSVAVYCSPQCTKSRYPCSMCVHLEIDWQARLSKEGGGFPGRKQDIETMVQREVR